MMAGCWFTTMTVACSMRSITRRCSGAPVARRDARSAARGASVSARGCALQYAVDARCVHGCRPARMHAQRAPASADAWCRMRAADATCARHSAASAASSAARRMACGAARRAGGVTLHARPFPDAVIRLGRKARACLLECTPASPGLAWLQHVQNNRTACARRPLMRPPRPRLSWRRRNARWRVRCR